MSTLTLATNINTYEVWKGSKIIAFVVQGSCGTANDPHLDVTSSFLAFCSRCVPVVIKHGKLLTSLLSF